MRWIYHRFHTLRTRYTLLLELPASQALVKTVAPLARRSPAARAGPPRSRDRPQLIRPRPIACPCLLPPRPTGVPLDAPRPPGRSLSLSHPKRHKRRRRLHHTLNNVSSGAIGGAAHCARRPRTTSPPPRHPPTRWTTRPSMRRPSPHRARRRVRGPRRSVAR